jgi:hypothetical protein
MIRTKDSGGITATCRILSNRKLRVLKAQRQ